MAGSSVGKCFIGKIHGGSGVTEHAMVIVSPLAKECNMIIAPKIEKSS